MDKWKFEFETKKVYVYSHKTEKYLGENIMLYLDKHHTYFNLYFSNLSFIYFDVSELPSWTYKFNINTNLKLGEEYERIALLELANKFIELLNQKNKKRK